MNFKATLFFALCLVACDSQKKTDTGPSKPNSPVLVQGDGFTVTAADLQAAYQSLEKKKTLVEELVKQKLLVKEARAAGIDKLPELNDTFERMLVQRLLQSEHQKQGTKPATEQEMKAYYDSHLEEFAQPEMRKILYVVLPASPTDPQREKRREAAESFVADFAKLPKGDAAEKALSDLIRKKATAGVQGGAMPARSKQDLANQLTEPFAQAVFTAEQGKTSKVVETPLGFFVFRVLEIVPGKTRTFDEAKPTVASKLNRNRYDETTTQMVSQLREKANIKFDDSAIDKVPVNAPATNSN
jgi:peptidyl-prolyl cis-trans isomerase C